MPKLERLRKRQLFDEVLKHASGMWYTVIDRNSQGLNVRCFRAISNNLERVLP